MLRGVMVWLLRVDSEPVLHRPVELGRILGKFD